MAPRLLTLCFAIKKFLYRVFVVKFYLNNVLEYSLIAINLSFYLAHYLYYPFYGYMYFTA